MVNKEFERLLDFYKGLFPYGKKDFYDKTKYPMFLDYKLILLILKHQAMMK